jgi:hypothetical protein
MFDGIEVRSWNRKRRDTDDQRRKQMDVLAAYQRAVYSGSPGAIIDRAHACRTLRIELAVEDALPVVVALALTGERTRFVRSRRRWTARFSLDGSPAPDEVELRLTAALLDAIEDPTRVRDAALRCLGSIMGGRGRDVTAHALNQWGAPGF